jgi:hypothetical protein
MSRSSLAVAAFFLGAVPGLAADRPRLNVAVRDGDWKLLVNADGTGAELYDLAADPNETKDRAADRPDVVKRLSDSALRWRKTLP